MGVWRSVGGMIVMRVTSAEPCALLREMTERGVILYGVTLTDPLTAEFVIRRKDMKTADALVQSRGDKLEIISFGGVFWRIKALMHRRVLLAGCALLLFLSLYLPTRILFIDVQGNNMVPGALILEMAEQCGIRFGSSREEVRSERVKNALLQAIPELKWVGVNTTGCSATISVQERAEGEPKRDDYAVSRIVACRDGIVSTVVCTGGNALCAPGQAVREGQTLISGYTDCGLSIRAERAVGEVFAFTEHQIQAVIPCCGAVRGEKQVQTRQYSLVIGKKRINLWKDSGISDASCVKIYEEKWVSLPGGFRLPVKLAVETWLCHDQREMTADAAMERQLQTFCVEYLRGRMLSGSILYQHELLTQEEASLILQGRYECLEMIGRERNEEIVHGKND